MQTIHLIGQASFFKGLEPESRRALAGVCQMVALKKRATLFREGENGVAFFLLVQGRVQLHMTAPDGRETVIKAIMPGDVFAEVVLFENSRYPVTAIALTSGLALRILTHDIHHLLREDAFRRDFIASLMRKQRYLANRIHQLTTMCVEDRLIAFLREQFGPGDHLSVTITKQEIARAIGTTPETLSRLIRRLGQAGTLVWRGRSIRLRHPAPPSCHRRL